MHASATRTHDATALELANATGILSPTPAAEQTTMKRYWIDHCPPPRTRPQGYEWDIFISYRSINRPWAIALYDMLVDAGYRVFLDQFVLVTGQPLVGQLEANLERSASGVLLWSSAAADSKWVKREYNQMQAVAIESEDSGFPFHLVVAKLDAKELPAFARTSIYVDFSDYPDGPSGAELVRLTYGLSGRPLDNAPVLRIAAFEEEVREEPQTLHALVAAGLFDQIEARALSDSPAYTTSATLLARAADRLIAGKQYEAALRVIEHGRETFRRSLRLRQLAGLALRRLGRTQDAILALEMLRADGHQDPETLGMLAAAWADTWEARHKQEAPGNPTDALERSRDLYRTAFEGVPSDTYVGINAASKSAMLGELDTAKTIATAVLERLEESKAQRGGRPSDDYWERATEPEARLLLGQWDEAFRLYHEARVAHQNELGSVGSTWKQIERLLGVLPVPEATAAKLRTEFASVIER